MPKLSALLGQLMWKIANEMPDRDVTRIALVIGLPDTTDATGLTTNTLVATDEPMVESSSDDEDVQVAGAYVEMLCAGMRAVASMTGVDLDSVLPGLADVAAAASSDMRVRSAVVEEHEECACGRCGPNAGAAAAQVRDVIAFCVEMIGGEL